MASEASEPIIVCLGFPALHDHASLDGLRAIHPRIEPILLPVDPGADWLSPSPAEPHAEPPAWGMSVAAERKDALARAEVLIGLHTSRGLMALAPRLKWIHSVGAGVDGWVASGVSSDRVFVTNSSGLGARSISEFVMGRLLQVWKNFRLIDEAQREHRWAAAHGRTFGATTMGIIGLGAIGEAVAIRAQAFGIRVLAMKRSYRPGMTSPFADELFGPEQLHAILGQCDSVVVAAPHTPETEGLIDAAALAAMRPGAVLVNVARGPLVDAAALVAAMQSGHLGAAILDVFDEEPLPESSPFWELPNTYLSPHAAVAVDRYVQDLFDLFAENLRRYATGEPLKNVVDMDALGFRRDP